MMHLQDLWRTIVLKVQPQVKTHQFATWFQDTAVLEFSGKTLKIGVPNVFSHEQLAKKWAHFILDAAKAVNPEVDSITYEIQGSLFNGKDGRGLDVRGLILDGKTPRKLPNKQEVKLAEGVSSKLLNPRYTLDNFVVGPTNRLAHAASLAVGRNPGGAYNPLFVYGGVGLGKTHLLQGIGHEILRNNSDAIVVYIPSERFVNEIVDAIGKRHTKEFRARYRKVDCLIIDDVQFLANKDQTQEEFFHTFNELYDARKQIIISADRPPKELSGLADRLRSRFEMGMIVDVQFPDFETRLAILHAKCTEHEVLIPSEVLEFIAHNVHDSVRELEGVLLQAIAQAELEQSTPTVRSVGMILARLNKHEVLMGYQQERGEHMVARNAEDVLQIVSTYYNLRSEDIVSAERRKEVLMPRQIAMYLIRQELNQSLEAIGTLFGGRNHTTVLHACEKIIEQLRKDQRLVRDVNAIKKEMGL